MQDSTFIEKLSSDKKFFKEVAYEKGLMGLFSSSHKKFVKGKNHRILEMQQLVYYKPGQEGTDEGFGEYAIIALVLNQKGEQEINEVKAKLKEEGLLNDIGNLRFEAMSNGYWTHDIPDFLIEDKSHGRIRRHSTENVMLFAFCVNKKEGPLESYQRCILAINEEGKRCLMPFQSKFLND